MKPSGWLVIVAAVIALASSSEQRTMSRRIRPNPSVASANPANPIALSRMPSTSATLPDSIWAVAGVQGGIPSGSWANCNNTNCNNIAPGGGSTPTGALVNGAISGAQVGGVACSISAPCVVRIKAGTFTINQALVMKSGVAVRGAGPSQTLLSITATDGSCAYNGSFLPAVCGVENFGGTGAINWTAGYSKGTTRITVANRAGIVAGVTPIHLMRTSETDGVPASGDHFICDTGGQCSGTSGGAGFPGSMGVSGLAVALEVLATACVGGSCTGSGDVDIEPPIYLEDFTTGATRQAMWPTDGTLSWAGLEDLSIDWTSAGGSAGISWINTSNTWLKNIRLMNTGSAGFGIALGRSVHTTIRDSYLYRTSATEQSNYSVSVMAVGSLLYENNICQGHGCNFTTDNSMTGTVFSYNFNPGNDGPAWIRHLAGEVHNLLEGNIQKGIWSDVTDGTGCCITAFRNGLVGNRYQNGGTSNVHSAFTLEANNRDVNIVGNVMGDASLWTTYQGQTMDGCSTPTLTYDIGGNGCSSPGLAADARTAATMLRWGNWDDITSTSPTTDGDQTGTRWCGNSSSTGWAARCGSVSEVPTGITNFSNAVPSTETLPTSLYLSAKPSFFGSDPWPGIGPDVSGGSVTNLGGHVTLNPAAKCFFTTMGGATDGSGGPYTFTCW